MRLCCAVLAKANAYTRGAVDGIAVRTHCLQIGSALTGEPSQDTQLCRQLLLANRYTAPRPVTSV
jgi:hypothetical protein